MYLSEILRDATAAATSALCDNAHAVQVLQRMLPDNTECFTFLAGDVDARLFDGDIPANMFAVWVVRPTPAPMRQPKHTFHAHSGHKHADSLSCMHAARPVLEDALTRGTGGRPQQRVRHCMTER